MEAVGRGRGRGLGRGGGLLLLLLRQELLHQRLADETVCAALGDVAQHLLQLLKAEGGRQEGREDVAVRAAHVHGVVQKPCSQKTYIMC